MSAGLILRLLFPAQLLTLARKSEQFARPWIVHIEALKRNSDSHFRQYIAHYPPSWVHRNV